MILTSQGVDVDGRLADLHSAYHEGLSPPLRWNAIPGAQTWALIVEDPDAPRELPFVHWMIWGIPGDVTRLDAGLPNTPRLASPHGAVQGRNDKGDHGWFGAMPPMGHGVHRYHFQLFAVDGPLHMRPESSLNQLVSALKGRVVAEGEMIATYERPEPHNPRPPPCVKP